MFLKRQGEAKRSTPFQPPMQRLGKYKARQGDSISVKNERKGGGEREKKDKARIEKAARTPRILARVDDALKTRQVSISQNLF
jgi:hypothetical protein